MKKGAPMKLQGKCKALRIYVDEDLKWHNQLLYRAIVEKLLGLGIAGATVFKGVEGYGSSAHIHSARILEITENLPVLIEVVDVPKQVLKALQAVEPMLPKHCLVLVQDVKVLHYHAPKGKHSKTSRL
jgi:PII-like signaling protein